MTTCLDVDMTEMPHDPRRPSDDEPRAAEAGRGVPGAGRGVPGAGVPADGPDADPAAPAAAEPDDLVDEHAAVQALLGTITTRLTEAPDELTRRRHLAAMRRAGTRSLLLRVAQRTGAAAAVALVAGGLLAGGGLLPDPVQREVADRAAQVGIELPRPASPDEAGSEPRDADEAPETVEPAAPDETPRPERGPAGADDHGRATSDDARDDIGVAPDVADADERPGPVPRAPGAPDDVPDAPGVPDTPGPPDLDPDERRHVTPIEPPVRPEPGAPDRERPRDLDETRPDGGGSTPRDADEGERRGMRGSDDAEEAGRGVRGSEHGAEDAGRDGAARRGGGPRDAARDDEMGPTDETPDAAG
jgi:hypothetical protein